MFIITTKSMYILNFFIARKPNAQAKVINGVDAYSINSKGKATYLSTVWTGSYKLNKKATLT